MPKQCAYGGCRRPGQYWICWLDRVEARKQHRKGHGLVCASHDRELGRRNLMRYVTNGDLPAAIAIEKELRKTENQ